MRSRKSLFKGRQFTAEVILWAVRWYLQFPISYRDLCNRAAPVAGERRLIIAPPKKWLALASPIS